jgi:hypothetical protein
VLPSFSAQKTKEDQQTRLIYYIRNIDNCGDAAYHRTICRFNHSELQMEFVPLALLAIAVVGLGSAATVLLAQWIPQPVAALAAQHGRFAGLGEQDSAATPAAPYDVQPAANAGANPGTQVVARVQQEAMNVVRTTN